MYVCIYQLDAQVPDLGILSHLTAQTPETGHGAPPIP